MKKRLHPLLAPSHRNIENVDGTNFSEGILKIGAINLRIFPVKDGIETYWDISNEECIDEQDMKSFLNLLFDKRIAKFENGSDMTFEEAKALKGDYIEFEKQPGVKWVIPNLADGATHCNWVVSKTKEGEIPEIKYVSPDDVVYLFRK